MTDIKVDLIDHMGSDLSVVNAARVSFDKESDWEIDTRNPGPVLSDKDQKLIRYLAEHNHWSPFAHAFASFRIKAPIFVARQLVKHQVGLAWNEESRRYIDSEPEFYYPVWRGRPDGSIKQGSSAEISVPMLGYVDFMDAQDASLRAYNTLLDCGVAPEQARMVLPLNTMTQWIWSGSLMAFARVCNLRLDSHAQAETRDVAVQISAHMQKLYPHSWEALTEKDNQNV